MRKFLATLLLLASFVSIADAGIIARPTKTTGGTSFTDATIPHASDFNGDADTIYVYKTRCSRSCYLNISRELC